MTARIQASPKRSPRIEAAVPKASFRPEIQGLRSLAVLMVVTYHIWFGRVSGGVDIFLLLSAFLMTLQFVGRYQQGRPMMLVKHWLHLFRRLLPAAVVVIIATLAASSVLLPPTRWLDMIAQGWASLFYAENLLLQSRAVDYFASDQGSASPFQHFWSLSIQGQVFILWPVIFALTAFAARRYRLRYRVLLAYVFAAIFLVSLISSIVLTASNQPRAYFDTGARLWEFALGTLVALLLPGLRLSGLARIILGWLGLAGMILCGIVLNVQAAFPGIAALWPTLAAAFVIAAGQTGSRAGADRLLGSPALVRLGNNSYALYLWHWPVLVLTLAWTGLEHAGWLLGGIIIAVSLLLASVTTRFIEAPWREWKWPEVRRRRAVLAVAACLLLGAAPMAAARWHVDTVNTPPTPFGTGAYPGANAINAGQIAATKQDVPYLPTLSVLEDDWPVFDGKGCKGLSTSEDGLNCDNGRGSASPAKTVVVLGNSHAHVWSTPLLELARKYNWHIIDRTKGFCPLSTVDDPPQSPGCPAFNRRIVDDVISLRPDAVVTTTTRSRYSEQGEVLDPSWAEVAKRLNDGGVPVVGIRDNPRFTERVPECVMRNNGNTAACDTDQAPNYQPVPPTDAIAPGLPGTAFLDFSDKFCAQGKCPVVIGNVLVYKDDNHVSATYMKTLVPAFEERFLAATGWAS